MCVTDSEKCITKLSHCNDTLFLRHPKIPCRVFRMVEQSTLAPLLTSAFILLTLRLHLLTVILCMGSPLNQQSAQPVLAPRPRSRSPMCWFFKFFKFWCFGSGFGWLLWCDNLSHFFHSSPNFLVNSSRRLPGFLCHLPRRVPNTGGLPRLNLLLCHLGISDGTTSGGYVQRLRLDIPPRERLLKKANTKKGAP